MVPDSDPSPDPSQDPSPYPDPGICYQFWRNKTLNKNFWEQEFSFKVCLFNTASFLLDCLVSLKFFCFSRFFFSRLSFKLFHFVNKLTLFLKSLEFFYILLSFYVNPWFCKKKLLVDLFYFPLSFSIYINYHWLLSHCLFLSLSLSSCLLLES